MPTDKTGISAAAAKFFETRPPIVKLPCAKQAPKRPPEPRIRLPNNRFVHEMEMEFKSCTRKIAYGLSQDDYRELYRTVDGKAARKFWARVWSNRDQGNSSDASKEEYIRRQLGRTANYRERESFDTFVGKRVQELVEFADHNLHHADNNNYMIISGPIGSGKSAYSKIVMKCGLRRFWQNLIIPCRIEYSKYSNSDALQFIFRSTVRDMILYLCANKTEEETNSLIDQIGFNDAAKASLIGLAKRARQLFDRFAKRVGTDTDIYDYCKQYELLDESPIDVKTLKAFCLAFCLNVETRGTFKVLYSFDGFDCIEINEMFGGASGGAANPLQDLHSIIHKKAIKAGESLQGIPMSAVCYMRDTTWVYFKTLFRDETLQRGNVETKTIAPPDYERLAGAAIRQLGHRFNYSLEEKRIVREAGTRVLRRLNEFCTARAAENDFLALLGDNARKGQRHIKDFLLTLLRLFIDNHPDYDLSDSRRACLLFAEWLVKEYRIFDYVITQSLFLDNEERFSNFCNISQAVIDSLGDGTRSLCSIDAANAKANADKIDNLFNYLLDIGPTVETRNKEDYRSYLLYGIRILQLIRDFDYYTFRALNQELVKFGYVATRDFPLDLVISCLLRAQFISVRPPEVANELQDLQYYCTSLGKFALTTLIYDVGYVGRAVQNSILPKFLCDAMENTEGHTRRSMAIYETWNALLMALYVGLIERWELVNLKNADAEHYEICRLSEKMKIALSRQAVSIFNEAMGRGTDQDKECVKQVFSLLDDPKFDFTRRARNG